MEVFDWISFSTVQIRKSQPSKSLPKDPLCCISDEGHEDVLGLPMRLIADLARAKKVNKPLIFETNILSFFFFFFFFFNRFFLCLPFTSACLYKHYHPSKVYLDMLPFLLYSWSPKFQRDQAAKNRNTLSNPFLAYLSSESHKNAETEHYLNQLFVFWGSGFKSTSRTHILPVSKTS